VGSNLTGNNRSHEVRVHNVLKDPNLNSQSTEDKKKKKVHKEEEGTETASGENARESAAVDSKIVPNENAVSVLDNGAQEVVRKDAKAVIPKKASSSMSINPSRRVNIKATDVVRGDLKRSKAVRIVSTRTRSSSAVSSGTASQRRYIRITPGR
jgi:hypothetical protein